MNKGKNKKVVSYFLDREDLVDQLVYIENEVLRTNIAISYKYAVFLIVLEEQNELPGSVSYSLYKDVIIHLASIVESVLYYAIRKYLDLGIVESREIMGSEWKDSESRLLYKISDDKGVYGVVRHRKDKYFVKSTQFQKLNKIGLKAGIITKDLYEKAESLRTKRNKIHLGSIEEVDDYYEKSDVIKSLNDMQRILIRAKTVLGDLEQE